VAELIGRGTRRGHRDGATDVGWHVTVKTARRKLLSSHSARVGYCCSIAALLIFLGSHGLQNAVADGETRTISFHHIHTGEDLTVTYKVDGRYDEEALNKINQLLRDWRETEAIRMDPHLIDLLWEVHREVNAKEPIWVVCGYRSPQTNSMLRRRSSGVAEFSQHMLGKAVDFYIPGVGLDDLRAAGLRAQRGGVGYYPTSGAPFVHLDTGSVRHWPRMPEAQLASVLSRGPLRYASNGGATQSTPLGFFARLFGGGRDEQEDAQTAAPVKVSAHPAKPSTPDARSEKTAAVPLPQTKPVKAESYQVASAGAKPIVKAADRFEVASATSKPVRVAQAGIGGVAVIQSDASVSGDVSANDVINARGYWRGLPDAADAPPAGSARAQAPTARRAIALASAEPANTASATPWPIADRNSSEPIPTALAYASQPTSIATARSAPLAFGVPRATPVATPDSTVAVKRSDERPSAAPLKASIVRVGDRFDDPWMHAMIVSPSAQNFLKTTVLGPQDFRELLGPHLLKPAATMVMSFSNNPHGGMRTEKFDGSAVVFMSTATFSTAALR
jgi:uncharacterized protein YcbK (DUF882 family)